MKKRRSIIKFSLAAAGLFHLINKWIDSSSITKQTSSNSGIYYHWKHGDIYYKKKGHGAPLLLIHDLSPLSASFEWNELTDYISRCADAHKNSKALCYGDYKQVVLTNKQCIFQRQFEDERILIAVNADSESYTAHFDAGCGQAENLLTGEIFDFGGGAELAPYTAYILKMEQ